jgi:hypothetical protein
VIPEVTLEQFIDWGSSGAIKAADSLQWRDIPAPPPLEHVANKLWGQFVDKVNKQVPKKPGVLCIGCPRYAVTATLRGRLEYQPTGCVKEATDGKFGYYTGGFGHLNHYPARLVVAEVVDFIAKDLMSGKP